MIGRHGTTRREFLGSTLLFVAALVCVGQRSLGAPAAGTKPAAKPAGKPRPPGTCGGWTDPGGNGICDRSENGPKPCGAVRCPGHKDNAKRDAARAAGAPDGTCAQWEDPPKAGFCSVSTRADNPCIWVQCPANKNAAVRAVKKSA